MYITATNRLYTHTPLYFIYICAFIGFVCVIVTMAKYSLISVCSYNWYVSLYLQSHGVSFTSIILVKIIRELCDVCGSVRSLFGLSHCDT